MWRKGKVISEVVLGIKLPVFSENHEINMARIQAFMAEVKARVPNTEIGLIAQRMMQIDKEINEKVYSIFDINAKERTIIEEAIELGRPYLRY